MIILGSGIGNYVCTGGKKYSYFGGNNYLGLANHPGIIKASIAAIRKYGVNFSASRITTGTADVHLELEYLLSKFKKKDDTVLFPSGYLGNSILLGVLKSRNTAVLIDRESHPSIAGSIPRDISSVQHYNHCDTCHLESLLQQLPKEFKPLVMTDGVFALTGEIAPLDRIYPIVVKHKATLIVDDAHSTGILGPNGLGTPEHFQIGDVKGIYQTETLSKALGSYGGFISGNKDIINLIREQSEIYRASTALPPSVVAAGIASLNLIREQPELRLRLAENTRHLREGIFGLGFHTTHDITPIIPVILPTLARARELSWFLEKNGIIVPLMNYPVKLDKYMVRITVSAIHTTRQIGSLLKLLKKWRDKHGNTED